MSRASFRTPIRRHVAPWLLFVLAALAVGCASAPDRSPPQWLQHHQPPQPGVLDPEALRARLVAELAHPESGDDFLKPEEIAAAAFGMLRAGALPDACLLLAAADYRYRQEAHRVARRQETTRRDPRFASLDPSRRELAEALFEREVSVYVRRDFSEALSDCAARLVGEAASEGGGLEALERMLLGKVAPPEELLAQLRQPSRVTPQEGEFPVDEALKVALLKRLREDSDTPGLARRGFELLAMLPFSDFQLEALAQVSGMAEPLLLRALLRYALPRDEPKRALAARFADATPAVRSNLAILAGLDPGFLDTATLRDAQKDEPDPFVRLSLAFALAARGEPQGWELLSGVATGEGDSSFPPLCREHAISLLYWMPEAHLGAVTPALLLRVLEAARGHYVALAAALAFVERLAPRVGVEQEALTFVMARLRFMDDDLLIERLTATLAAIPLLDRATLRSNLEMAEHPRQRVALLVRFGRLAQMEDIPRLRVWWEAFPDEATRKAILRVVGGLPGEDALDFLMEIHSQPGGEGGLRRLAGLLLALRRDTPPAFADRLLETQEEGAAKLLGLMGDPRARPLLHAELTHADAARRFAAVELIGLLGLEGFEDALWRQAAYSNPHIYPHDAILRHGALRALFSLELRTGVR